MIPRALHPLARQRMVPGQVLLLLGARRTGKTTLLRQLVDDWPGRALVLNGEDQAVQQALSQRDATRLRELTSGHDLLALDEAQAASGVGALLKLLVDTQPELAILATGSSSLDLGRDTGEPLTGRSRRLVLHPMALCELLPLENPVESASRLEGRMLFGGYPEVATLTGDSERRECLVELANAYLFKDILQYEGIRRSDKLLRLLQLVALQVGRQVSLDELATQLGMGRNTVERYLDLLEQCHVVLRVGGFSRNLRTEIHKTSRWYFVDTGMRNAVLRNFQPLATRDDVGAIWENFLFMERRKRLDYERRFVNRWFWRTHGQQEIDLVEEEEGDLRAWEFKWARPNRDTAPSAWRTAYPQATFQVVHRDNHRAFVCIEERSHL